MANANLKRKINNELSAFSDSLQNEFTVSNDSPEEVEMEFSEFSIANEVKKFEMKLICFALGRAKGNRRKAAKMLGLNPTTLQAKIKKHEFEVSFSCNGQSFSFL